MTQEQPARRRPRPNFRSVEVKRVERLSPGMTRITLGGPELAGVSSSGPADHIRMWFPQPGYEKPVMPEWTDDGPVMPDGHDRPVSRVYTPHRIDAEAQELDIDIVLHAGAEGPGSIWAEAAAAGQFVVIAGPAGPYRLDEAAENFVLASDQTGLPALTTVLAKLPATALAHCYIEVADEGEAQELRSDAAIKIEWLYSGHDAVPGALLTDALASATVPSDARIFVACEAGAMRRIRKNLLQDHGLAPEQIHTHGYWKMGEANHPDHDLGDKD